jgi:four helix bundle protein
MGNFKELEVWQKGMNLVESLYLLSPRIPQEEKYTLLSQAKRAAISIPSNIAEGASRKDKGLIHFMRIALGSSYELETQLLLCDRLKLADERLIRQLLEDTCEVQKMLNGLIRSL